MRQETAALPEIVTMAEAAENTNEDQAPPQQRAGPKPGWMTAGGPAPVGRGKALFVGLLLIVAVAGLLVGVLMVPAQPVNAYLVSVPFALYEDSSLPPVAFAEHDTQRLVVAMPGNAENAYNAGELTALRNKLDAIAQGTIRLEPGESNAKKLEDGQPFIFHIVGHAAVIDDGIAIMPLKADRNDPSSMLPLAEVIRALTECPAQKKLLLLDLGRAQTNPFLGPLQDDVTPRLHDWLSKQRNTLPCPVFVSCSPGEESLVIPQVQASAFAFYLAEGLKGAADGFGSTPADSKVKVRELCEFVRLRVARWARQNRDLPQLAKLYEPENFTDFDLMLDVPPPIVEDPEPLKMPFAPIGTLSEWKADQERASEVARRVAAQRNRWAAAAFRAEQVYAGLPGDPRIADAVRTSQSWWSEVQRASATFVSLPYRSLVTVEFPTPSAKSDPVSELRMVLDRYAQVALPQPGVKKDFAQIAQQKGEFERIANALPPPLAARVITQWFFDRFPMNARPRPEDLDFASNAITFVLRNTSELFIESDAFALAASKSIAPYERPEARGTLMAFLKLKSKACEVLSRGSPGFGRVESAVTAANTDTYEAEQKLNHAMSRADVEAAETAIEQAMQKWTIAEEQWVTLLEAHRAMDDAWAVLSGTAFSMAEFEWPISSERGAVSFKDWTDLATKTMALASEIHRPAAESRDLSTIKSHVREIAVRLSQFRNETNTQAIKRLVDGAASARPADLRRYRALLATSLLSGADRERVWNAAAAIEERLHLATRTDADLLENAARSVTKPPTLPAPLSPAQNRRAEISVRLLELGGHFDADGLRAQWDAIKRNESAERWQALTLGLRQAWSRDSLSKWLGETPNADRAAQDRLGRLIPFGLWQDTPDRESIRDWRIAASELRLKDELIWRRWLAEHYRKYATVRNGAPKLLEQYQKAAQEADTKPQDSAQ